MQSHRLLTETNNSISQQNIPLTIQENNGLSSISDSVCLVDASKISEISFWGLSENEIDIEKAVSHELAVTEQTEAVQKNPLELTATYFRLGDLIKDCEFKVEFDGGLKFEIPGKLFL